jgi:hypothetical protein
VRAVGAAIAGFAIACLAARGAEACAVCATADDTVPPRGQEQPFAGRLRLTLDGRAGQVGAAGAVVDDRRAELVAAYAPSDALLVTLGLPALSRRIDDASGVVDRATPGDVELALRVVRVARSGPWRRRFGVLAALKLPTAPLERDAGGAVLASVLQPGCGSLVPAIGADGVVERGAWSAHAGASLWMPFAVRWGPHAGESLRASAGMQWQPLASIAVRAGALARLDAAGVLASGADDPDSGGLVAYAAGALVVTPMTDVTLEAGALYPAVQLLRGAHHEGAIAALTLGVDL